ARMNWTRPCLLFSSSSSVTHAHRHRRSALNLQRRFQPQLPREKTKSRRLTRGLSLSRKRSRFMTSRQVFRTRELIFFGPNDASRQHSVFCCPFALAWLVFDRFLDLSAV